MPTGKFLRVTSAAIRRAIHVSPASVDAVVSPAGAVVTFPDGSIAFPPGAVSTPTTITVSRHPQVHGVFVSPSLSLHRPATIRANVGTDLPASPIAAHIESADAVDVVTGAITGATELIPARNENGAIVFQASRFSGYIFAGGIAAGEACDPSSGDPNCVWVEDA